MDGSFPEKQPLTITMNTDDIPAIQVPFGGTRSPTPSISLLSGSVSPTLSSPTFGSPRLSRHDRAPVRLGATSQDEAETSSERQTRERETTWTETIIKEEYEWSAGLEDAELIVPTLNLSSFNFERWNADLLRMLVGKFPYLIHDSGKRLIDFVKNPLERRGNRILYSSIWNKLTENSAPQAELFKNQSSAGIGDGIALVRELQAFFAYGEEEPNVAAVQLPKLKLVSNDPDAVDKFLNDLLDGWARAGSLVNDVTVITLLEDRFKNYSEFTQMIDLARLLDKWNAHTVIKAVRGKARDLRMARDMKGGLPGTESSTQPNNRRGRQLSSVTESSGAGCRIHGQSANHSDAECRAQQGGPQPDRAQQHGSQTLDPALPKGACNGFFLYGSCRRGAKCRWTHDVTKHTPAPVVEKTSSQAAARVTPNLIDLDVISPSNSPAGALIQLAQLPSEQLSSTHVLQAELQ